MNSEPQIPRSALRTPRSRIEALHTWYCSAMGGEAIPLNMAFERYWFDWLQAGYNGPQLRRVMIYIRREIQAGRRNPGSLKLSNLLNPERFAEDLILLGTKFDKKLPALPESEGGKSEVRGQRSEVRPETKAGAERTTSELQKLGSMLGEWRKTNPL